MNPERDYTLTAAPPSSLTKRKEDHKPRDLLGRHNLFDLVSAKASTLGFFALAPAQVISVGNDASVSAEGIARGENAETSGQSRKQQLVQGVQEGASPKIRCLCVPTLELAEPGL